MVVGLWETRTWTRFWPCFRKEAEYYITNADIPRALPASELAGVNSRAIGLDGTDCSSGYRCLPPPSPMRSRKIWFMWAVRRL